MKDKVVIITGATSGIGLATAKEFASLGARVVIAARTEDTLRQIEEDLVRSGGECMAVVTDVSKEEDCRDLVRKTVERFGKIDILINNAGISMRALFLDLDLMVLKRLMDVNFWGTVYCTKNALPYLLKTRGSVVGISSIAGIHGLPGRTGYSASKFAMNGFLETLRLENRRNGLHVMILAPGFTESNIRRAALLANGSAQGESPRQENRLMAPSRVAKHIVRGIRNRRKMIILSFEGKATYWCKKWCPSVLEKIVYHHMAKEPNSPFK